MGFDDMEKSDKIKLFVAIGVLVVAIGAIGWYFFGSGGGPSPTDTPAAAPAPDVSSKDKNAPKPASNRRTAPGGN
ncbi:MAG: hypothetical protein HUU19_00845 [Phycisphaerales bacterium]|jgi:hypothetical protein|nr:hypothetical protein [Phycisphaerales bacterium]